MTDTKKKPKPKSTHPDKGGNWPAKTPGQKSGKRRGNAVPRKPEA
ncbi:hypothetical protein [Marinomonas gallaica]